MRSRFPVDWLSRLTALIRVADGVKTTARTFLSIVAAILAVLGVRNFAIKYKLTSLERIQQVLFVTDNRIEVKKILNEMTSSTDADRAFFAYFEQLPNGEMAIAFLPQYQWQKEGQLSIQEQKYPIKPGADSDRRIAMEAGRCNEVSVSDLSENDSLGLALKNSHVEYQIACPVRDVIIDGQRRLGFVALEFNTPPVSKTKVRLVVAAGAVDVGSSFD